MFLSIDRIRDFGIFRDYTKPSDTRNFLEKNIIYGWNYSGKTTISRIFQSIEYRELVRGLESGSFQLATDSFGNISELGLSTCPIEVRVFNTDFVKSNLSWDGDEFAPILLLGGESIEAQKEIEKNKSLIERIREAIRNKESKATNLEDELSRSRTKTAAHIKKTLAIVEAYTAAHLNQKLPLIRKDPGLHLLDAEKYSSNLKKSLASASEKLPSKVSIVLTPLLTESTTNLLGILSAKPALTNTISNLTENGILAQWVREGLDLHKELNSCEFCGNSLTEERRKELKSHFSKDLDNHEEELRAAIKKLDEAKLSHNSIHPKDFYPVSRAAAKAADETLKSTIASYNEALVIARTKLVEKLESPFTTIDPPELTPNLDLAVSNAVVEMNKLIVSDNEISKDFDNQKRKASDLVRNHLIAEYCNDSDLGRKERIIAIVKSNRTWFGTKLDKLLKEIATLEAKISHAQKGKDELNAYISRFLTGSSIEIQVVNIEEQERFCIVRGGKRASHLSEGEKTAVAFAFFLTKLKEIANLQEIVVFIDDPVSSLDSNHLFQVYAVIKEYFFRKDPDAVPQWSLTVRQIFFSTHNFEFLKLLKDLPLRKNTRCARYYVKRIDVDSSTLINMPNSLEKYSSEYQYLWDVIYTFHTNEHKEEIEILLALPNVVRRFVELYTYSKYPTAGNVDLRADVVFGPEKAKRIIKILHYFSHSNNIHGLAQNNDLICDIANAVAELVKLVKEDALHYDALMESVT